MAVVPDFRDNYHPEDPDLNANEERLSAASEGASQLELELPQPSLAPGLPSLTVHAPVRPRR